MQISIRQAGPEDSEAVANVLLEAAAWLRIVEMPMWRDDELGTHRIKTEVEAGLFFVAESVDGVVGTIKFQLSDPIFWPEMTDAAAYVHRLAVRRACAGGGASLALLSWAAERTRALQRHFLRLDCEAARPRLRAVYERFGFRHHSDRQIGPYSVARYEYAV